MLHVNLYFLLFARTVRAVYANVRDADALHVARANRAENKRYWKSRVYMKHHPNGNLKNIMAFSAEANLTKNFTSVAVEFRL